MINTSEPNFTLPANIQFSNEGLYSWYNYESANVSNKIWYDLSGNNRHGKFVNNVLYDQGSNFIYGTTQDGVDISNGFPGDGYTFFHVTRYNGINKKRIWVGDGSTNWFSGHLNGQVSYYHNSNFLRDSANNYSFDISDNGNNWVFSTDTRYYCRINGVKELFLEPKNGDDYNGVNANPFRTLTPTSLGIGVGISSRQFPVEISDGQ